MPAFAASDMASLERWTSTGEPASVRARLVRERSCARQGGRGAVRQVRAPLESCTETSQELQRERQRGTRAFTRRTVAESGPSYV